MPNEELQRENAKNNAVQIVKILDSKKADDLKMICVREKTPLADYFIICTANSTTQLRSLADEIEFQMKTKFGVEPKGVEGKDGWILIDYYSVIVHVFTRDARDFYKLDKLWADGEEIDIAEFTEKEEKKD